MGDPKELGLALKAIRRGRGLRQSEMARRAGITKAMACGYEQGHRLPSLRTLERLMVALDIDLDVLHRALCYVRRRRRGARATGGPRFRR